MNDTPTATEVAWCAGLIEGEGTIYLAKNRHPVLAVRMTDLEPLERLKRVLGGVLVGPYEHRQKRADGGPMKSFWLWHVHAWKDFIPIAAAIEPWLCPRRLASLNHVMEAAPEHPCGTLACPDEPIADVRGYQRHIALGIPVCFVCKQSRRLWFREYNASPDRQEANRAYRERNKERIAANAASRYQARKELQASSPS